MAVTTWLSSGSYSVPSGGVGRSVPPAEQGVHEAADGVEVERLTHDFVADLTLTCEPARDPGPGVGVGDLLRGAVVDEDQGLLLRDEGAVPDDFGIELVEHARLPLCR
jgi:hypothetical protein